MDELLGELSLNGREGSIYHYLQNFGPQTAGTIARSLGINRSSLYICLEKLTATGVIFQLEKNGLRVFSALPTKNLLAKLQRKQTLLAQKLRRAENELETLHSKGRLKAGGQQVRLYCGTDGLLQVLDNVLAERPNVLQAFITRGYNNFINEHAPDYPSERRKRNISALAIHPFGNANGTWQSVPQLRRHTRTVPQSWDRDVDVLNYGCTTTLVAAGEKFALSVNSDAIGRLYNTIFQLLWRRARVS